MFMKVQTQAILSKLLSPEVIHEREKMRRDNPDMFAHVARRTTHKQDRLGIWQQISRARWTGRIGQSSYDAKRGVYAVFDLGMERFWLYGISDEGEKFHL